MLGYWQFVHDVCGIEDRGVFGVNYEYFRSRQYFYSCLEQRCFPALFIQTNDTWCQVMYRTYHRICLTFFFQPFVHRQEQHWTIGFPSNAHSQEHWCQNCAMSWTYYSWWNSEIPVDSVMNILFMMEFTNSRSKSCEFPLRLFHPMRKTGDDAFRYLRSTISGWQTFARECHE